MKLERRLLNVILGIKKKSFRRTHFQLKLNNSHSGIQIFIKLKSHSGTQNKFVQHSESHSEAYCIIQKVAIYIQHSKISSKASLLYSEVQKLTFSVKGELIHSKDKFQFNSKSHKSYIEEFYSLIQDFIEVTLKTQLCYFNYFQLLQF